MSEPEDSTGPKTEEPPAKARNAERFERQARALRENLRRRQQQKRADTGPVRDAHDD